jgi:hypothetical protein
MHGWTPGDALDGEIRHTGLVVRTVIAERIN